MNENMSADDRIESAAWPPLMNVGPNALDIRDPFIGRASCEGLQCGRINVHRSYAAITSDDPGGKQRDVANAAADIEHVHAGRHSRATEELFGQGILYRGLKTQAAAFPVIVSHRIRRGL